MLGLGQMGQTSDNLIRSREVVINLPSQEQVSNVDRLAMTTGKDPVPAKKRDWGYVYDGHKFATAGLTPVASESVAPPRIPECPVQMEGMVHHVRPFGKNVSANAFEIHITPAACGRDPDHRPSRAAAYRPGRVAAAADELLSLLRNGGRSTSIPAGRVGVPESFDPASGSCVLTRAAHLHSVRNTMVWSPVVPQASSLPALARDWLACPYPAHSGHTRPASARSDPR